MKPIKITIINIGPFVGSHEIDFTSLDNIYIITGKTGSGKTTILDCITYALYGKLPGSRSNSDKRHLRSDFCSTKEMSSICFDFSLTGKHYRVERTLPFTKTTKRGTQSEESESAILYQIDNVDKTLQQDLFSQSSELTILESQKSRVDETIEKLLLLSIDEFTRIVLLPQGEFATFLKQNSKDRKSLLIKLFPIELFTRIAENIKEEKTKFEVQFKEILLRLEQIKNVLDPESATDEKEKLENECKSIKLALDTLQSDISNLAVEKNNLFEKIAKLQEFKSIEKQVQILESKADYIQNLERKLSQAHEAEKIIPLANNFNMHSNEYEKNSLALLHCKEESKKAQNENNTIQSEENDYNLLKEKLSTLDVLIHELERSLSFQENIQGLEVEVRQHTNDSIECQNDIENILNKYDSHKEIISNERETQDDFETIVQNEKKVSHQILLCKDKQLLILEENAKKANINAERILDDFEKQAEMQKCNSIASSLTEFLEDGKECPVCGSLEHPNPAKNRKEVLDISEKIQLQKEIVRQAEEALSNIQKERYTVQGSITESKKSLINTNFEIAEFSTVEEYSHYASTLEVDLQNIKQHLSELEQKLQTIKEAKDAIAVHETILNALQEKEKGIQIQLATANAKLENNKTELNSILEKTHYNGQPIEAYINSVKTEKLNLQEKIQRFEKRKKDNDSTLLILNEKVSYIEKTIKENLANKEKAYSDFVNSTHGTSLYEETVNSKTITPIIERINASIMQADEKQEIQQTISDYYNESTKTKTLYNQLKNELHENVDDIQKHLDEVQKSINERTTEMNDAQNKYSETQSKLLQLESLLSDYKEVEKRKADIGAQHELYTKLHNVISGNNPKKIPLDSWILGMYLQEITIYANSRLKRISNGRYRLHLKQDAEGGNAYKGLDLEIYDDYTGKSRPTSTLSGGETFITSISLALAISDMVQSQNGGVQLDSMFIDEGFGSLDPESLEKALSILDEIRETRTIALISHVETLQSRISSQIRINKFISGSTIEVCNS